MRAFPDSKGQDNQANAECKPDAWLNAAEVVLFWQILKNIIIIITIILVTIITTITEQ